MSSASLTRDALLEQLAEDERLRSIEERCEVYATFVQWSDAITPAEYEQLEDGGCRAHPIARTVFDTGRRRAARAKSSRQPTGHQGEITPSV